MSKKSNSFNFFIPLEIVKGSVGSKTVMKIKGIASSRVEDADGEVLDPSGFNLEPLLTTGFFNYNHQASKSASAIIGEPTKAEIINNGKDLYVEGFLYPDSAEAIAVYKLAATLENNSETRRLGFSIEGQAIERDPLNPKRVTKANLTSIAITPSPKNPNTLLSIMKGEYKDSLADEDEEEEEDEIKNKKNKKEKAIMAEGSAIAKESVDHSPRNIKFIDDNKKISKSDVYDRIFATFKLDTVEKAKRIYTFVENTQKKLDMSVEITNEALEKALETLELEMRVIEKAKQDEITKNAVEAVDATIDIEKSEEVDIQKSKTSKKGSKLDKKWKSEDGDDTGEDGEADSEVSKSEDQDVADDLAKKDGMSKSDDKVKSPYGVIAKSDEDDEEGFVKKMAKKRIEKGMSKDEAIEDMVKKGIISDVAITAVNDVMAEMNAQAAEANGGQVVPQEGEMTKGFADLSNLIKSQRSEFNATIESLTNISKAQSTENDFLKKSLTELSERLNKIESEPVGRKSVVNSKPLERFEKSHDASLAGKTVLSLTNKDHMGQLADTLISEWEKGGRTNSPLEKAIKHIDIHKGIEDKETLNIINPYLRENNIVLEHPGQ